jgi:hypothetical protein
VTAAAPQGGRVREAKRRTKDRRQRRGQHALIDKLTIPPAGAAPIFDPAPASALLATAPRPGPAPAPAPPRRPASADAPLPPLHVTRTDGGKGVGGRTSPRDWSDGDGNSGTCFHVGRYRHKIYFNFTNYVL